ncbi:hypothetical protein EKO04_010643 [Ascochyta lentis]|uniref:Uncharacterized protein n=1 Tax=Ascochyta lentis TaxID=205686 RepID=A0A8H7IUN8_9PLEO|nr:hypothetical protein EKO04_010643 [Ascochyta lentis]
MAGLRRTQDIDQWRPEELSVGDRERSRERPRERIDEPRTSSPVPRAARDTRTLAREELEPGPYASTQSRVLQGPSLSSLEEGTQRGPGFALTPAPPPRPPRHNPILKAPPQPLCISTRQPQARQTAEKSKPRALEIQDAPRKLLAPSYPEGTLSTPATLRSRPHISTTYTRHVHSSVSRSSPLALC